ncbi:hypothetical protein Cgig2_022651 [Carnegiea gigantea]|uniref:Uncharacterized protein n=1 Tax=Carnegiea gigantea TaxID=171969 RepID=A0A9Q1JPQ1_9CARY|nr:hypothetical protein Cgig2_022651 [Carnegiea gigantea]
MTSNYKDLIPIDVDSNGADVAEAISREAKRPTTIQTRAYKPCATDAGVEGNLLCKCKKYGQTYPEDSKYGTENLKGTSAFHAKSSKGSSSSSNPTFSNALVSSNVEPQSDSFMHDFDQYSSNEFESVSKFELEMYLEENKLPRVTDRYSLLLKNPCDIMTIPLSTIHMSLRLALVVEYLMLVTALQSQI